jgi:hypothetical protein
VVAVRVLCGARVELAPALVGIGGMRSLRGQHTLARMGFVR